MPPADLFPGFAEHHIDTGEATIHARVGGRGPGLLLLHGYPQSHVVWHLVAPELAKDYTVVAADLRGYGDSSKPDGGPNHINYSKRRMAADQTTGLVGQPVVEVGGVVRDLLIPLERWHRRRDVAACGGRAGVVVHVGRAGRQPQRGSRSR